MSTDLPQNDLSAFIGFLNSLPDEKRDRFSPEQSLRLLREHAKREDFRRKNELAQHQSQQGLSQPLDLDSMLQRIDQRAIRETQQG